MSGLLEGSAVVVTGAGAGLGRAYALAAAGAGAAVVVNDLDGAAADETTERIRGLGGRAFAIPADVSDPATGERLVAACLREFGRLDGLVNNAGLLAPGPAIEQTPETAARILGVNVAGTIHCGVAALRAMIAARTPGSVVNVASGALQGTEGLSLYGATKGAVMSLSYAWALELAGTGIRCNVIAPLARTAMSELSGGPEHRKGGPAETVAPAVVYLLSPLSAGVTGQILRFDGRRLGLMDPPQLTAVTERESWRAEEVAEALGTVLADAVAPVGLAASPRPRWV